jgi:hypothetical protein
LATAQFPAFYAHNAKNYQSALISNGDCANAHALADEPQPVLQFGRSWPMVYSVRLQSGRRNQENGK